MEDSNKDLARARFKQHRRDAFRDSRGRGGRGRCRGVARNSPFDNTVGREEEEVEIAEPSTSSTSRPPVDLPSDEDDDKLTADGSVRPKSSGADLQTLFAECDQAALPRQHARTYLDPSWAVDDLAELERVMGTRGDVGDVSLDPTALQKHLSVLPLADLLGLSEDYRKYMQTGDEVGNDLTVTAPDAQTSGRAEVGTKNTSGAGVPEVTAAMESVKVTQAQVGSANDTVVVERDSGTDNSSMNPRMRPKRPTAQDDELDALLEGTSGGKGTAFAQPATAKTKAEAPSKPATSKPSKPAKTATHDDDAFLDELLG